LYGSPSMDPGGSAKKKPLRLQQKTGRLTSRPVQTWRVSNRFTVFHDPFLSVKDGKNSGETAVFGTPRPQNKNTFSKAGLLASRLIRLGHQPSHRHGRQWRAWREPSSLTVAGAASAFHRIPYSLRLRSTLVRANLFCVEDESQGNATLW